MFKQTCIKYYYFQLITKKRCSIHPQLHCKIRYAFQCNKFKGNIDYFKFIYYFLVILNVAIMSSGKMLAHFFCCTHSLFSHILRKLILPGTCEMWNWNILFSVHFSLEDNVILFFLVFLFFYNKLDKLLKTNRIAMKMNKEIERDKGRIRVYLRNKK